MCAISLSHNKLTLRKIPGRLGNVNVICHMRTVIGPSILRTLHDGRQFSLSAGVAQPKTNLFTFVCLAKIRQAMLINWHTGQRGLAL